MRKTLLTTAATLLCAATVQAAVEVKIGYSNIAGEFNYTHQNQAVVPTVRTNKVEDISAGVVTFGGAAMASVSDMVSIGFSAGASMSGEWELDHTIASTPPVSAAGIHGDSGDKTVYALSKLPIMARASVNFAAGPGVASLGVGLGAIVFGWTSEQTDTMWWDGTNLGSIGDKNTVSNQEYGKQVTTDSGATPLFAFEIAPAYDYKLNEKSSIGLEIPLQFVTETTIMGGRTDYTAAPPANTADPTYTNPEIVIGGLEWGVNVVYKVKI